MKKLLLILAAFISIGASDGYTFKKAEFTHTEVAIKVIVHRDQAALEEEAIKLDAPTSLDDRINAFSIIKGKTCEIHMLNPKYRYKPELIGHEFLHCVYGRWHD